MIVELMHAPSTASVANVAEYSFVRAQNLVSGSAGQKRLKKNIVPSTVAVYTPAKIVKEATPTIWKKACVSIDAQAMEQGKTDVVLVERDAGDGLLDVRLEVEVLGHGGGADGLADDEEDHRELVDDEAGAAEVEARRPHAARRERGRPDLVQVEAPEDHRGRR